MKKDIYTYNVPWNLSIYFAIWLITGDSEEFY